MKLRSLGYITVPGIEVCTRRDIAEREHVNALYTYDDSEAVFSHSHDLCEFIVFNGRARSAFVVLTTTEHHWSTYYCIN